MQLYKPDHNLPATRVLFDTALLAAQLRTWLGNSSFELSISSIRYKPGTSCVVGYQIRSGDTSSYLHAKAFTLKDWQTRRQKLDRQGDDVWQDEEHSFAVFRIPSDAELPDIREFSTDPNAFLARVLFKKWAGEEFSQSRILAYKPNRRFTAKLEFQSGQNFVLKIHDDTTFSAALQAAQLLKHATFVKKTKRTGRSNRHRSLANQWIDGETIDFATCDSTRREDLLQAIFVYLDTLHESLDLTHDVFPVQDRTEGIAAIARYLGMIYPPANSIARQICSEILQNSNDRFQAMLTHGDFHERQLISSQGNLQACDFDACCLGDPTMDLANLVGHLQYRGGVQEISSDVVTEIDESVSRHFSDNHDRAFANRYRWNRIAALFRLATNPFRTGSLDWIEQTQGLLDEVADQCRWTKSASDKSSISTPPIPWQRDECRHELNAKDEHQAGIANVEIERDAKLAFVVEALDIALAERVLKNHVPVIAKTYGNFEINRIFVRRLKPGRRCLIEYELNTDAGARSILGKVSAKRADEKTFQSQSTLHGSHGFDYVSTDGISVPRPLGIYKPWKMWFQEKVAAQSGKSFLKKNRLASIATRIAATIAKLHACGFSTRRSHSVTDELNILGDRLSNVIAELPQHADRISRILGDCIAIGNSIEESLPTLIHRDFYHDQIMFSNEHNYLVDLDLLSMGPRELDVGNFLAHLTEHGIRHFNDASHWASEEREILNQYVCAMPSARTCDIEAYKAISLARHISVSWSRKDRQDSTRGIIDETESLTTGILLNLKQGITT